MASEVDTKKVVDLVQQYHPNVTDLHISATIPIGSNLLTQSRLLYVKYTRPDRKSDRSLVYLPFVGDPVPFDSSEEFIRQLSGYYCGNTATHQTSLRPLICFLMPLRLF